jgi:hypothetical protein
MKRCMMAAAVLWAMPALADTAVPKIKNGMWSQTQSVDFALPGHDKDAAKLNKLFGDLTALAANSRFCADDAIQDKLIVFGEPQPGDMQKMRCSGRTVKKTATGFEIDYSCKQEGRTVPMRMAIAGDLSKDFTSQIVLASAGGRVKGSSRFRYLGACTDLKPGEIMIPGMPKTRMERVYAPLH